MQSQVVISDEQFCCETTEPDIEANRWYHIVVRVSRQKQELWINGKLRGTQEMTNPDEAHH
ncbi:unnamed protein product, partial [Didymodactylos carnosus]